MQILDVFDCEECAKNSLQTEIQVVPGTTTACSVCATVYVVCNDVVDEKIMLYSVQNGHYMFLCEACAQSLLKSSYYGAVQQV